MKQFLILIFVFMIAFSVKAQLKPEAMTLPINWGDFEGMKDVGWGLINIGYMF